MHTDLPVAIYARVSSEQQSEAKTVESQVVKAGAITSRLRNGRPDKTNSKERTSTFRQQPNAGRTAPGSLDPNADEGTPLTECR
jgi:hypothetical protein